MLATESRWETRRASGSLCAPAAIPIGAQVCNVTQHQKKTLDQRQYQISSRDFQWRRKSASSADIRAEAARRCLGAEISRCQKRLPHGRRWRVVPSPRDDRPSRCTLWRTRLDAFRMAPPWSILNGIEQCHCRLPPRLCSTSLTSIRHLGFGRRQNISPRLLINPGYHWRLDTFSRWH